jgi:hypothetical protein
MNSCCAAGSTVPTSTTLPRPYAGEHYAELVGGLLDGLLLFFERGRADDDLRRRHLHSCDNRRMG